MTKVFSQSEARRRLDSVLEQANETGEARIKCVDGREYVVTPADPQLPADHWLAKVGPVVDLGFKSTDEIVQLVREERERVKPWEREMLAKTKRPKKAVVKRKTAKRSPAKARRGAA